MNPLLKQPRNEKALIVLLFFSFILTGNVQDDKQGLEFHSVSISPLSVYFADRDSGLGGNRDVGFNSGDHNLKYMLE